MSLSKKVKKCVKRPRVDWFKVLWDTQRVDLRAQLTELRKRSNIRSLSRLSFAILKHNYSTTALDRVRWFGEAL